MVPPARKKIFNRHNKLLAQLFPVPALAALIGPTRAAILTALAEPSSTTALAQRLQVTPGAVSQHLSVLRAAGTVTCSRVGRQVLYRRTRTGDTLAASH